MYRSPPANPWLPLTAVGRPRPTPGRPSAPWLPLAALGCPWPPLAWPPGLTAPAVALTGRPGRLPLVARPPLAAQPSWLPSEATSRRLGRPHSYHVGQTTEESYHAFKDSRGRFS